MVASAKKYDQQLTSKEISYLSLLLSIIHQGNWKAFAYSILQNQTNFQHFCHKLVKSKACNGMSILHAVVRNNPPIAIIKLLLKLCPELPSCVDCLNRTSLHVAAGTRADVSTLELIATAYPKACMIQDDDGKTPLHLACDTSCELFQGDAGNIRSPPSEEVVKTLIKACGALSVPIEDQDGMTALEHAIFSNTEIRVVKLLQYATRKQSQLIDEAQRQQQEGAEVEKPASPINMAVFSTRKRSRRVSLDSYTNEQDLQRMRLDSDSCDESLDRQPQEEQQEQEHAEIIHTTVIPAFIPVLIKEELDRPRPTRRQQRRHGVMFAMQPLVAMDHSQVGRQSPSARSA